MLLNLGGEEQLPFAHAAGWSATQRITTPPTYVGNMNNGVECSKQYMTSGFEPIPGHAERHPLFLYFAGTKFGWDAEAARRNSELASNAVTEAMARRGFVALAVQYDNSALAWISDHRNQLHCLFAMQEARSLLNVACALPNVDCDLGVAIWGHSLGALVAHLAHNYDPRVSAVWATGYGGSSQATLSMNRLRVVNGEKDFGNASVTTLNNITGFTTTECPDNGRSQCLRDDGSGWVIVRAADVEISSADHCWFEQRSCWDPAVVLEPSWIDPASQKPYALESNADWVARTARKP